MRWHLSTGAGDTLPACRTAKERDEYASAWLMLHPRACIVLAVDTRTGRAAELSRPLRRRTIRPGKKGGRTC